MAGVTQLDLHDTTTKLKQEFWTVTTNGLAAVSLNTTLHRVESFAATWAEKIGATAAIEVVVDNSAHTVSITVTEDVAKDIKLILWGF